MESISPCRKESKIFSGTILRSVSPKDCFVTASSSIDLLKPRSDPTPGCKRLTKSNPTIIAKVLVDK